MSALAATEAAVATLAEGLASGANPASLCEQIASHYAAEHAAAALEGVIETMESGEPSVWEQLRYETTDAPKGWNEESVIMAMESTSLWAPWLARRADQYREGSRAVEIQPRTHKVQVPRTPNAGALEALAYKRAGDTFADVRRAWDTPGVAKQLIETVTRDARGLAVALFDAETGGPGCGYLLIDQDETTQLHYLALGVAALREVEL